MSAACFTGFEAATPGSQTKNGNYIAVTRWKITARRDGDYGNFVTNMLLPLNSLPVKEGRSMSWSAARVVSPGGEEAPFNAVLSNTVKDLTAALPTTAPNPDWARVDLPRCFEAKLCCLLLLSNKARLCAIWFDRSYLKSWRLWSVLRR
jgi:hypothetical protein